MRKGSLGSFMSCSKESSVAKMKTSTRLTKVTDSLASPGFIRRMTAWAGPLPVPSSPYQKTQSASPPRTGSWDSWTQRAISVSTEIRVSWEGKNSRARGCTKGSQAVTISFNFSSSRGLKERGSRIRRDPGEPGAVEEVEVPVGGRLPGRAVLAGAGFTTSEIQR